MKERTISILRIIITGIGVVVLVLIWLEKIPTPFEGKPIPMAIIGVTTTFLVAIFEVFKKKNAPLFNLDFETATKLADEKLKEEIELRDKTIENLEKELARKNLPAWEQVVKDFLEKNELLKAIESINTDAGDEEAAQKHIRKAQLYIVNFQYNEAEQHFLQAVTIFPSFYNSSAIAEFYYNLNEFSEAITYYNHCLNLTSNLQNRAAVLNNLGLLRWKTNEYPQALEEFGKALEIHRKLVEESPKAYLPNVAMNLNNLGLLYSDMNKYPQALEEYEEALVIYRKLAKENPKAYLPDVAMTLNNLAVLHSDMKKYPKSLEAYKEALEIRRNLAEENSQAYLPDVAMTLNNLANLYSYISKYPQALEEYEEALEIYRKLVKENPKAYLYYVAGILNNLAGLHRNIKKYSKAEEECKEALEIYKKLAEECPEAYLPDMANTLNNLALFYLKAIPNKELSFQYVNEAIAVCAKCNDTPYVRTLLEKAKWVIEEWNKE